MNVSSESLVEALMHHLCKIEVSPALAIGTAKHNSDEIIRVLRIEYRIAEKNRQIFPNKCQNECLHRIGKLNWILILKCIIRRM